MSDNWVVQNLQNALGTWNDKLAEVWQLMTMSPENFKGGGIWNVILNINGAMQAIGLALLVLFFLAGVVQTSANLTDVKRPEHALKLFLRFAIAKGVVTYGLELIDVILEMSDDLCHGCQLAEFSTYSDPVWESKYIDMMRPGSEMTQCDTEVHVEKGDITKAEVDAIVNPANTNLTVDSGLSKAIYMAAGPEYLDACVKLGKCKVSEALITKGYNLTCRYVIHTVGPSWKDGKSGEKQLLRKTYESILKLAENNGIRSIALPSISTGKKGYPVNEAARVAVSAVINFVEGHPDAFDEIVWIVGSDHDKEAYENQIGLSVVSKLVSSSSLNAINDILRNGKLM